MGTSFGKSAGGYFWAIAQPLGGILLLSIAFSLALRSPPFGDSFLFFYSTGIVPFQLFNNMSRAVSSAVASNRGLLAYPVVSILDAIMAKFLLTFMTNGLVAVLLIGGIIVFRDMYVVLDWADIVTSYLLVSFLGLGVGAVNCVLFGFFPTWKNIWTVITRPLFILSGIFYVYESIPTAFQHVVWYNPLLHCIGLMRAGFFGAYEADYASPLYVLCVSMACFVLGGYLVRRHAAFLIEQ